LNQKALLFDLKELLQKNGVFLKDLKEFKNLWFLRTMCFLKEQDSATKIFDFCMPIRRRRKEGKKKLLPVFELVALT